MRPRLSLAVAVAALSLAASLTAAEGASFSLDSEDAIKKTASTLAWDMMQYYKGNLSGETPGILPGPPDAHLGDYYWWQAGAMWGTLIDYWSWTGDSTYNDEIMAAMQWQAGPDKDYQPRNITASLGNDDQAFWGMSAMLAAEAKFPDPPSDKPQWLALAQAVFNTQAAPERQDNDCGGGLHWQAIPQNKGYNYKNSIANGCFFNLGARLYRYTGNKTYSNWAIKTWDWMEKTGLLDNSTYAIYDGAHVPTCKDINLVQYSYNNAVFAQGAAFMYNATEDPIWKERTKKLVEYGLKTFFPDDVAVEIACENGGSCTTDMLTYKGYVHRWYATITQILPATSEKVTPILKKSAAAAIKQCTGGALGRQCGLKWASGTYDGKTGAGQEMSALAAVSSLLVSAGNPPVTDKTGGTSKGNPNAGSGSGDSFQRHYAPITTADRAGAGILTFIVLATTCGAFVWMCFGV